MDKNNSAFIEADRASIIDREKNHAVKLEKPFFPKYSDEILLEITHNGYQWTSMNLSKDEAKMVINVLKQHFKL